MPNDDPLSWPARIVEKAASRAQDEAMLETGEISSRELSRINGGGLHRVRYVGPSKRFQQLAAAMQERDKVPGDNSE